MDTIKSLIEVFNLNEAFFVYIALFFIFLFLTSKGLLSPYLESFLKRDEQTQGRFDLSLKLQKENQELEEKYKVKLVEFNKKFQEALKNKEKELLEKNLKEIELAQKDSQKWIHEQLASFKEDFLKARGDIQIEAPKLAEQLASKIF